MYLLGVIISRYYDFWLRKTAFLPWAWIAGSIFLGNVVGYGVLRYLPNWLAVGFVPFVIVTCFFIFFAASKNSDIQSQEKRVAWERVSKTKQLIQLRKPKKY